MTDPSLNLVLYTPQIPNNTGNIGRTALAVDARLHLIHPLGFSLSEKACRRAGLDYWRHLDVVEHGSWDEYLESQRPERLWLFSTKSGRSFRAASWMRGDHLLFGPEDRGLPLLLARQPDCHRAPLARLLTRRLPPKGRASPRRQGLRVTGGPSFSHGRGLARRLISAFSRSFPPDNPLLLWV